MITDTTKWEYSIYSPVFNEPLSKVQEEHVRPLTFKVGDDLTTAAGGARLSKEVIRRIMLGDEDNTMVIMTATTKLYIKKPKLRFL